jgi:general secretion pathway protein E
MGVEPFMVRSGILAVVCQRLVRRLCSCASESDDPEARLGLPVYKAKVKRGCPECQGTGYRGRVILVEMLTLDMPGVSDALLSRRDANALDRVAVAAGMRGRWDSACDAVTSGLTTAAEVRRVLGFTDASHGAAD